MDTEHDTGANDGELKFIHELRTVEELRALSDPLRVTLMRLLKEQARSVKDLCDILGEKSTRLYYHVRELERVGLVRLVRTETRSGSVMKYYRAVARYVEVPFDLLQDQPDSPEATAGVAWNARMLELGALDVRQALTEGIRDLTDGDFFVVRQYVRTTPERAREFVRRLEALHQEFVASDDEQATSRYTLTCAFVPVVHQRTAQTSP